MDAVKAAAALTGEEAFRIGLANRIYASYQDILNTLNDLVDLMGKTSIKAKDLPEIKAAIAEGNLLRDEPYPEVIKDAILYVASDSTLSLGGWQGNCNALAKGTFKGTGPARSHITSYLPTNYIDVEFGIEGGAKAPQLLDILRKWVAYGPHAGGGPWAI